MNDDFSIRPPSGYELSNVLVNDQPLSGMLGDLLDDGRSRLQMDWVERLGELNQGGGRVTLLTGPEYMGVMRTLFNHRNDREFAAGIESLRQVLQQDFAKYWMMTGSRLFVTAQGEDYAVHGIDRAEPQKVFGNLTGGDGYLSDHDAEFARVTLDATVDEVKEIYGEWVNGRRPYAWRLSRKPPEGVAEWALLLGRSDVSNANFSADSDYGSAARGWVPKISSGNGGGS
jgi:hypothetical protein